MKLLSISLITLLLFASLAVANEAWLKAFKANDLESVVALYAPDAVLYPPDAMEAIGTAVRSIPSAADLTTTCAPDTTLPCASLIVPSMVETVVWANAGAAIRDSKTAAQRTSTFMIPPPKESYWNPAWACISVLRLENADLDFS